MSPTEPAVYGPPAPMLTAADTGLNTDAQRVVVDSITDNVTASLLGRRSTRSRRPRRPRPKSYRLAHAKAHTVR